ncbi:uncharacterized protein LOC144456516 [Phascolarctos cinereus]
MGGATYINLESGSGIVQQLQQHQAPGAVGEGTAKPRGTFGSPEKLAARKLAPRPRGWSPKLPPPLRSASTAFSPSLPASVPPPPAIPGPAQRCPGHGALQADRGWLGWRRAAAVGSAAEALEPRARHLGAGQGAAAAAAEPLSFPQGRSGPHCPTAPWKGKEGRKEQSCCHGIKSGGHCWLSSPPPFSSRPSAPTLRLRAGGGRRKRRVTLWRKVFHLPGKGCRCRQLRKSSSRGSPPAAGAQRVSIAMESRTGARGRRTTTQSVWTAAV